MDNYYVEFLGGLKDDKSIQERFFKHYNAWCKIINKYIPELNESFDANWTDYRLCRD